jgi:hypothetical protein
MSKATKTAGGDTRFKKGKSGNRRGRPYGSQNILIILRGELDRYETIAVNGKPTRMRVREALEYVLVNGYCKGSQPHIKLLEALELVDKYEPLIIEMSETERRL